MANINGNRILEKIRSDRNKIPKYSGTISSNGKILVHTQGSKPIEGKPVKHILTPKQSFLNQIQDYNDFIVQNDLDAERIDPSYDYDFSAFTSPEDWVVESGRLADRLSDRKIEIAQNEDAGEFAGMELENGVPSYEATQNMDDEEFKAYEQKYLTPSEGESLQEPQVQRSKQSPVVTDTSDMGSKTEEEFKITKPNAFKTSADKNKPFNTTTGISIAPDVGSRITDEPFDPYSLNGVRDFVQDGLGSLFRGREEGRDRRYVPKDLYIEKKMRDLRNAKDTQKVRQNKNKSIHTYDGPSPLDRIKSLAAEQSFPVAKTIASTVGSIVRLKDQYEKEGAVSIAEDLGNSTMSGLAAPFSDRSSKFWKDRLNTPTGEASSVGKVLADEALFGAVGGAAGKGLGTAYKRMRHGGEDAREKIIRLADKQAQKRTGKMDTDALDLERLKQYEGMTRTTPLDPYSLPLTKVDKVKQFMRADTKYDPAFTPAWVHRVDKISTGIKKEYGSAGMIRKNDDELIAMFEKTNDLNKARAMQQKQWDQLPDHGMKIGGVLGVAVNGDDEDDDIAIAGTPTKPITPLVNPMRKKTSGGIGTGAGSMKNNGRTAVIPGI